MDVNADLGTNTTMINRPLSLVSAICASIAAGMICVLISWRSAATRESLSQLESVRCEIIEDDCEPTSSDGWISRFDRNRCIKIRRTLFQTMIPFGMIRGDVESNHNRITEFDCPTVVVGDEDAVVLSECDRLRVLRCNGGNLTDAGMSRLSHLRLLQDISISAPQVGDDGFRWLPESQSLRSVDFSDSRLSDSSARRLFAMPQLSIIRLSGTRISSLALSAIGGGSRCIILDVSRTRIDIGAAQFITRMSDLAVLNVGETQMNDEAVRELLVHLPNLRSLSVEGCSVSRAAFLPVGQCRLTALNVSGTQLVLEDAIEIARECSSLTTISCRGLAGSGDLFRELDALLGGRRQANE